MVKEEKNGVWEHADIVRIDRERKVCDLVSRDTNRTLKDVGPGQMQSLPTFAKGMSVDFWNGARWISDVRIVGLVNNMYDVAWKSPPQRLHKKWIRRHRHDRVCREVCRPKSPTRAPSVRDALAVMDDVHMKSSPLQTTSTSKKSSSFKKFGRAVMKSLAAVRLIRGGREESSEKKKQQISSSSPSSLLPSSKLYNSTTRRKDLEKEKVPKIVRPAREENTGGNEKNVEGSKQDEDDLPENDDTSKDQDKDVSESATDEEIEENVVQFQPGDRAFCLQKSSTAVWFPGRVIGLRHKKNKTAYVFKSDDSDEERTVTLSSLIAVEEEEYQPSSGQSIPVGTRVFALDIDAEDNFHWLLATISSSSPALVVYDGESEPQSAELLWCLKNQSNSENDDGDDESYIFDDTASSSVDEEEEEYLEKRFNTARMRLHTNVSNNKRSEVVETNL